MQRSETRSTILKSILNSTDEERPLRRRDLLVYSEFGEQTSFCLGISKDEMKSQGLKGHQTRAFLCKCLKTRTLKFIWMVKRTEEGFELVYWLLLRAVLQMFKREEKKPQIIISRELVTFVQLSSNRIYNKMCFKSISHFEDFNSKLLRTSENFYFERSFSL